MKIIFTKHALERLAARHIDKQDIIETLQYPQRFKSQPDGKRKFIKYINGRHLQAVATHIPSEDKWIVVSVWVRGEQDQESLVWRVLVSFAKLAIWLVKAMTRQVKWIVSSK